MGETINKNNIKCSELMALMRKKYYDGFIKTIVINKMDYDCHLELPYTCQFVKINKIHFNNDELFKDFNSSTRYKYFYTPIYVCINKPIFEYLQKKIRIPFGCKFYVAYNNLEEEYKINCFFDYSSTNTKFRSSDLVPPSIK